MIGDIMGYGRFFETFENWRQDFCFQIKEDCSNLKRKLNILLFYLYTF